MRISDPNAPDPSPAPDEVLDRGLTDCEVSRDRRSSRRDFLRKSALAVGGAGMAGTVAIPDAGAITAGITAIASTQADRPTPDEIFTRLVEGNKRFIKG